MTTKLTLTIDDEVIKKAKGYAVGKGRRLSELVENYFLSLTYGNVPTDKDELTPAVRSLMGSFKAPKGFDFDYKKAHICTTGLLFANAYYILRKISSHNRQK